MKNKFAQGVVVALKQLTHENPIFLKKSIEEASRMMPLKHKNIIRYLDAFIFEDVHYMVLEYANNKDLKDHIANQKETGTLFDQVF